jgi:hypothetical protein
VFPLNGNGPTGCDKFIYERKEVKPGVARLHFSFKIASVNRKFYLAEVNA